MNNPYAVAFAPEIPSRRTRTTSETRVAIALTLLATITILLESWLVVFPMAYFLVTTIIETPGFNPGMINGWMYLIVGALVYTAHWMVLFGAICMWRKSSFRFSMMASVLSIIPVLSPFGILGIPFGIWGVVALTRRRFREAFPAGEGVTNNY